MNAVLHYLQLYFPFFGIIFLLLFAKKNPYSLYLILSAAAGIEISIMFVRFLLFRNSEMGHLPGYVFVTIVCLGILGLNIVSFKWRNHKAKPPVIKGIFTLVLAGAINGCFFQANVIMMFISYALLFISLYILIGKQQAMERAKGKRDMSAGDMEKWEQRHLS